MRSFFHQHYYSVSFITDICELKTKSNNIQSMPMKRIEFQERKCNAGLFKANLSQYANIFKKKKVLKYT